MDPPGYRILIEASDSTDSTCPHFCGALPGSDPVLCPNCAREMFFVFDLDMADSRLASLGIWPRERMRVPVCPSCGLYTRPYWVDLSRGKVAIHEGFRGDPRPYENIDPVRRFRRIELSPLTKEDDVSDPSVMDAILSRQRAPGVYHQIGGRPPDGGSDAPVCPKCRSAMRFAGVVDYDDRYVPLTEDGGRPVSLIIGDMDSLHLHSCPECRVLSFTWVY